MRYQKLSLGLAAAALTMSLSSAWAQDDRARPRESGPASRPSSGSTVGSAVPRGSDGGSTSSPSAGTSSPSSTVGRLVKPRHLVLRRRGSTEDHRDRLRRGPQSDPTEPTGWTRPRQRHNNGASSGERAVPRGDSGNNAAGSTASTNASSGTAEPAGYRSQSRRSGEQPSA